MHHDPVEAARRQDAVEENQGFGAEADDVACLWPFLVDGFIDGFGYDSRVRHHSSSILLAYARSRLGSFRFISPAFGRLFQVICCDIPPFVLDAARFDERYVDAEALRFHAQGIGQAFDGVFRRMIPAAEVRRQAAAHGRDVDDATLVLLAHDRQDFFGQPG